MKKSSLIGHVCELLDLILPLKQPADAVMSDFFRTRHYLGSKDRRFISDTTFGILRHYVFLKALVKEVLPRFPDVSPIPLVLHISYSLHISHEEPSSVFADVESSWNISFPHVRCQSFLEALQKSVLPDEVLQNPVRRIATTTSFPLSIVDEWIRRFGESETQSLCESMNRSAPIVIRVNTLKTTREQCMAALAAEGIESEPTALSPVGLALRKRINAQALRSFKEGLFEMQDEGSQIVSLLLEPQPGQSIVDACAGGGGKTLHIAALMQNSGKIHAVDVDEKRLTAIGIRVRRAGVVNTELHHIIPGGEFTELKGTADAVLVDAPCSGVGTFRRNPATKLNFSEDYVSRISALQKSILHSSAELVRPGGRLVYSTCTLLQQENENVVEEFLSRHPDFTTASVSEILSAQHVHIESSTPYLILLPNKHRTDGFFAAAFQKKNNPYA